MCNMLSVVAADMFLTVCLSDTCFAHGVYVLLGTLQNSTSETL